MEGGKGSIVSVESRGCGEGEMWREGKCGGKLVTERKGEG